MFYWATNSYRLFYGQNSAVALFIISIWVVKFIFLRKWAVLVPLFLTFSISQKWNWYNISQNIFFFNRKLISFWQMLNFMIKNWRMIEISLKKTLYINPKRRNHFQLFAIFSSLEQKFNINSKVAILWCIFMPLCVFCPFLKFNECSSTAFYSYIQLHLVWDLSLFIFK